MKIKTSKRYKKLKEETKDKKIMDNPLKNLNLNPEQKKN